MQGKRIHPLDKLIADDSLFMLEAMVPFVEPRLKKMLVIFIKYKELSSILSALNDPAYVARCGFDCHADSTDDMLAKMCKFMPGDFGEALNQMKQIKGMLEIMNMMDKASTSTQCMMDYSDMTNAQNMADCFDMANAQNMADYSDIGDNGDSLYESIISILDNS